MEKGGFVEGERDKGGDRGCGGVRGPRKLRRAVESENDLWGIKEVTRVVEGVERRWIRGGKEGCRREEGMGVMGGKEKR